jgi:TonB family protein
MLELKPRSISGGYNAQAQLQSPQPRRLRIALLVLLAALLGILVLGRDFWFGSDRAALDSDLSEPVASRPVTKSVPSAVSQTPATTGAATKKQIHTTHSSAPNSATPNSAAEAKAESPVVASDRTVLPPLDVEVVAGDKHSTIHPGSNAAKVQITHPTAVATNAAQHEPMSVSAVRPPQTIYPVLAQHMSVQGSVVLQAVIGADGVIQDLHVLSGPSILATAAQQAVREWRFKPVYQGAQPVETQARITVNFNIKVQESISTNEARALQAQAGSQPSL